MWCWEKVDVASASAISAGWGTEGFVEFTVECDATVTAFSCAHVNNQMVEKCLSLYKRVKGSRGETRDWIVSDARLVSASTLFSAFAERPHTSYTWVPLLEVGRIHLSEETRKCG